MPIANLQDRRKYARDWAKTEKGRKYYRTYSRQWERNKQLAKFGLTEARFVALLGFQDGKCAMPDCRTTRPGKHGTWYLDHDHRTGTLRGLLCNLCNIKLGRYEADKSRHGCFESYLANPPCLRFS